MRQEVNLHQPVRHRRDPLSAMGILAWSLVLVALLGAVSAWNHARVAGLERDAREVEARAAEAESRTVELSAEVEAQQPDPALAEREESLEDELRARQRLSDEFVAPDGPWSDGFAGLLGALGRDPLDGVWFERIRARVPADLRLEGRALEGGRVPDLVERLAGEPELAGREFGAVRIDRGSDNAMPLRFTLDGLEADDG